MIIINDKIIVNCSVDNLKGIHYFKSVSSEMQVFYIWNYLTLVCNLVSIQGNNQTFWYLKSHLERPGSPSKKSWLC